MIVSSLFEHFRVMSLSFVRGERGVNPVTTRGVIVERADPPGERSGQAARSGRGPGVTGDVASTRGDD
jgi:hypothetical protein